MIELKFYGTGVASERQYIFLGEVNNLLQTTHWLCNSLRQFVDGQISGESCLDKLETTLSTLSLRDPLHSPVPSQCYTPKGLVWHNSAVRSLLTLLDNIREHCEIFSAYTKSEASLLMRQLSSIRGSVAYALLDSLGFFQLLEQRIDWAEPVDTSEGILAFLQDYMQGNHGKFFMMLYGIYTECPPFIPLYIEFPDEWEEFTELVMDSDSGQEILDYADYIFLPDVKAIMAGKVQVNEDLLDILKARESNEYFAAKLFPHDFARFLEKIPEDFSQLVLVAGDKLTAELMAEGVENGIDGLWFARLVQSKPAAEVYQHMNLLTTNVSDFMTQVKGNI